MRRFVFAQGRRYTLGTLAAGAARVACEGSARIDLRFDVEDRVSEKIQVRVTSADGGAWEMEMTGDAIERGVELRVPPAAYDVVVRASRHVAYATSVSAVAAGASITATLRALRVIDGLVVDAATGAAVSGARVHVEPGMESATARDGRFVLEIDPAKWPRQIVVRADGYGSRIVPLPAARADASLRTIALKPGRTVLAEIHSTRPGELVQVELVRLREDGRLVRLPIQAQRIAKDDRFTHTVRFEDVEPGDYVVLAEGSEPSQRAGVRVNVDEVDPPPLSIQLTPFRLRLRTTQNGEPFEGRAVLRQMDAYWEVPVAIGAKGDATIELWEGGRFTATVESRANAPFRARRTIDAGEDLDWQIEMPRAEVTGKVVDAETGAPVPNAAVALEMRSQRPFYRLSVSDVAGPDGAFRFAPVFAGEHIVKAAAAGYPATEVRYELGESDEQRSITIALKRTPSTMLSVLNARGLPIADADVFVCRGSVQLDRGRTDGSGKT
ncbi:MAG TPA: carboxypeptidase-like regulatory domain-containing protein, partial [Thermoanaerobaculia bacterium]|nr:carboxypeptidase-like regulatory domain-containing protein [Thermoanaerobaculia bacterium]